MSRPNRCRSWRGLVTRRARARSRCTSRRRRGGSPASAAGHAGGRRLRRIVRAGAGGRTSAIHARVAELEALVDQREVGKQVAGAARAPARASSRRSRCAGGPASTARPRARRRTPSLLEDSRLRPMPTGAGGSARSTDPRAGGPTSRPSRMSKVASSSAARSRAGRRRRRPARVVRPGRSRRTRGAGSGSERPRELRRRAPRARPPEPQGVVARRARRRRRVAPGGSPRTRARARPRRRPSRSSRSSARIASAAAGVELDACRARRDRAEQEPVPARLSVDLLRTVLEGGERHRARSEPDAGADRADVVEVVVERARARAAACGRPADRDRATGPTASSTACAYATVFATAHAAHARWT